MFLSSFRMQRKTLRNPRRGKPTHQGGWFKPCLENLEDRTLLSAPAVSINNISIAEGATNPVMVSGNLNPGLSTNAYRVNGVAGEQLTFHNVSASSNQATWILYDADNQLVPGSPLQLSLTNDFTAMLPVLGPYTLVISGTGASALNYSFSVTATHAAVVAASGFGTLHTGTLAAGASTSFSYSGTAGLLAYFESQLPTVNATLTDNVGQAFSYVANEITVPPVSLPRSGTYTLTIHNPANTTQNYAVQMLALPDAATPLTLSATVTRTVGPGLHRDFYSFTGSPGQMVLFDALKGSSITGMWLVSPGDHPVVNSPAFPVSLDDHGTYYAVVQSEGADPHGYSFRLIDVSAQPALAFNTPVSGTLAAKDSAQTYQFFGTAGQLVVFDGHSSAPAGTAILYPPSNQDVNGVVLNQATVSGELNGSPLNGQFEEVLPGTGTYTIVLTNDTAVDYSFQLLTPPARTIPLTLGTTVSDALTVPGQIDTYTFTGSVGQKLVYNGLSGGENGITALLFNPGGIDVEIGEAFPATLNEAGTYRLVVEGHAGNSPAIGTYSFRLMDAGQAPAQGLTPGVPISGTLNPGTQAAVYEFIGTGGHTLNFQSISASSNQATWTLFSPTDRPITSANIQSNFTVNLPTTGIYSLIVAGSASSPLNYNIQANDTVPTSGFGVVQTGALAGGASATFSYAGMAGQLVYFDSQTRSAPDITVKLTDGVGQVFAVGMSANTPRPIALPRNTTYTLTLHNAASSAENYAFRLLALPNGAVDLTVGNLITQSVASGARTDFYRFTGTAGHQLVFNGLQQVSAMVNVELVGPGNQVLFNKNILDSTPITLPVDGTYYLILSSSVQGPYTYRFQLVDAAQGTVSLNTPVSGTLTTGNSQKLFQFDGTRNQWLWFKSLANANGTWTVFETNQPIPFAGGPLGTSFTTQLPATGSYDLMISADAGSLPVSYAFEVMPVPAPTIALAFGTTYSSALTVSGEQDTYTFFAMAGQKILYNSLATGSAPLHDLLMSPSGVALIGAPSAYSSIGPYTLTETGTYRLVISGPDGAIGPYAFQLINVDNQPTLNVNSVEARFTVSLAQPATQVATVQYATAPAGLNPAQPGVDYVSTQGELVFNPGESSKTVTVLVLNDPATGVNETFAVNLSNAVNAGIVNSQGIATILENGAVNHNDVWTGQAASSGGSANWSAPGNWSLGHVPGPLDTAYFTSGAAFTSSTIDVPFTIASLAVDGTWGGAIAVNAALAVTGNYVLASGTFGGPGAVTIGGSGSRWGGGQINLGVGGFVNKGALMIDTSAGGVILNGPGVLMNRGTINEAGTNALTLENMTTIINIFGATYNLVSDASIGQSGGATLLNAGTFEKTKGVGVSAIASTTFSNTGTVLVQSGTLSIGAAVPQVSGSTLVTGSWQVAGTGVTLTITSAGNLTTLGNAQVTLKGGNAKFTNIAGLTTISPGASLNLGNGQSLAIAGNFSNAGTVSLINATLNLTGSVAQLTGTTLTGGTWIVNANSNLNFPAGSNITTLGGGRVTLSGLNSNFAALANLATIGSSSSLLLTAGRGFNTVGDFSNSGTVALLGGTLNIQGAVAQLSGTTLTGGTWMVGANSNLNFAAGFNITALDGAKVVLTGTNANFSALSSLNTIGGAGSLTLSGGRSFATLAGFVNSGQLILGSASTLTVNGSFTQAASGTLTEQIGGTSLQPTFGAIVASPAGTVMIDGQLKVSSTVVPALNVAFEIINNEGAGAVAGIFVGLPDGAIFPLNIGAKTVFMTISYHGGDGNDVVISRKS